MTLPNDSDWQPACAISPRDDANVEFISKLTGRMHRGRFFSASFVDADDGIGYPLKTVKEWRYLD